MNIANLNKEIDYQKQVTIVKGRGGLPQINIKNDAATAEIMFLGAHLVSYIPTHEKPLIWISRNSRFEEGVPIRGGIPICWPWFGKNAENPELPMHGFARQMNWSLENVVNCSRSHTIVILSLVTNDETLKYWNHNFKLTAIFSISDTLSLELVTTNLDKKPLTISQGIHTYFQLTDVEAVSITGFDGKKYFDKVGGANDIKTVAGTVTIHQEIDGVFKEAPGPFSIVDPVTKRIIDIHTDGSNSAVIWNPWKERSKVLPDYSPDAYRDMVCVETCNALEDARTLKPGKSHSISATYSTQNL